MFLWTKPYIYQRLDLGLDDLQARMVAPIVQNAGLYNGFLAAGLIRFSNARVEDDQHPDGLGMAIKLMDVPGPKLLEAEGQEQTHDFILLDSPVFFIKNAIEYASFEAARVKMESTE